MNNDKRMFLAVALMLVWVIAVNYVAHLLGWFPPPAKKPVVPPAAVAEAEKKDEPGKPAQPPAKEKEAQAKAPEPANAGAPGPAAVEAKKPEVALVEESKLVLGDVNDRSPGGYRLEAQLTQKGAGIEVLSSSRFDAEYEDGKAVKTPLRLIKRNPNNHWPASLTLTLNASAGESPPAAADSDDAAAIATREAQDWLDSVTWEVVRDDQGEIIRRVKVAAPIADPNSKTVPNVYDGEAIVFRTKAPNGVVVTKTFRLGKDIDSLEMELTFDSPDRERKVVYNLRGPHGIPIEGEWYTGTFRDLFFSPIDRGEVKDPKTYTAYDVAKAGEKLPDNTALPLAYAGVENQYFAALIAPVPLPTGQDDRRDDRTAAQVHITKDALQKSDVGFVMTSRPIAVAPGKPVVHTYRLFAGPKTADALGPYRAEGLASYRKGGLPIPGASYIGTVVITPTLNFMYRLTTTVAHWFGGSKGNYGIAIILLTVLVRGLMFPLGRKQAIAAQKMQALQPHLKAIQEKYKEDKERLTKETFALYKKYGVNPMGGCLPALVQLPIFVGLWQALNTSVSLRHETFLWIRDLAAPDMLFHLPFEVPWLGWTWFNLLPFVVVGLMLVQTQLFSPPATTPEAEQTQKMMKFMMVFMGVMFYKVPSGLGIYFITSSLWAIGERLLLPKVTHADLTIVGSEGDEEVGDEKSGPRGGVNGDGRGPRGGKGPSGGNGVEGKRPGRFAQFWEKVLEEAQKDPTYRKSTDERESKGRDKDRGNPRPRPRRR
jgi:YidC/Oxa1 family membrane protein insertase